MKSSLILLAFAALASAQTFPAQSICPSATKYGPLATLPAGFQSFVYGSSFACDVPLPNGQYVVTVDTIENRDGSAAQPVGVGVRVFSFALNSVSAGALDPFAAVGKQTPYQVKVTTQVTNGHLTVTAAATAGNAVLVALEIPTCAPCAPLGIQPLQVSDIPNVSCMIVQLMDGTSRCVPLGVLAIVPTGPVPTVQLAGPSVADWRVNCPATSPGCQGLQYVALRKPDGSVVKLVAEFPFPPSVTPAPPNWSPVGN